MKPRLVPYQRGYLADKSPRKVLVKSRRVGGSEVMATEIACAAAGVDFITRKAVPPRPQGIVSGSWTQSKKLLERVGNMLRGFERVTGPLIAGDPMATVIKMRNGVTIEAFGTRAAAVRGDGRDMTLDEFSVLPRAEEMWQAVMPMVNPTFGNPRGFNLRICFTPLGDTGMAFDVARGRLAETFSQHTVDIYQAIGEGFPLRMHDGRPGTIEDLREEMGDPDKFAQEFECSFLAANLRFISSELYDRSLYDFGDLPADLNCTDYAGMDVARKRDNSAILRARMMGDTLWHLDTEARRDEAWDDQEAWVAKVFKDSRMHRMCIDETGMGSQFSERLVNLYRSRVEPVTFTQKNKEALGDGAKLAFERGRIRMRGEDTDTKRDVLSLRRSLTSTGQVRIDAPATKDGHADRAWALLLCIQASGGATRSRAVKVPENVPSRARAAFGGGASRRSRVG